MVQGHSWEATGGEAAAVGGIKKGEVVGWYLPVRVVSEKALTRAGVRVMVQMRRVAVGRSAGAYAQAVGLGVGKSGLYRQWTGRGWWGLQAGCCMQMDRRRY